MPINYRKVHNFLGGTSEGASPFGSLVIMPSTGILYGTTYDGGVNNVDQGTIYNYGPTPIATPIGTFNTVYNFNDVDSSPAFTLHGYNPQGTLLVVGSTLYGTATAGGSNNAYYYDGEGVLFRYETTTNVYTNLHSFKGVHASNDGSVPRSGVIKSSNNKLYGTTANGGTSFSGTIYSYDLGTNTYLKIRDFIGAPSDGARPFGELTEDLNNLGTLYGLTREGGTNNVGTIYKITTAGVYTKMYDFNAPTTGAYPEYCKLAQLGNTFYGVTTAGGANGRGTIFSYQPPSTVTAIHAFPNAADGMYPNGTLIIVSNMLYGITASGGTYNNGTIYRYNLSTSTYEVLHDFGDPAVIADGTKPSGGLTYDTTTGTFFGTTVYGGSGTVTNRNGTIYQFEVNTISLPCTCYEIVVGSGGGSLTGLTCEGGITEVIYNNAGTFYYCYEDILYGINLTYSTTSYACNNSNQCGPPPPPPYTGQCMLMMSSRSDGIPYVYYTSPNPANYGLSTSLAFSYSFYVYATRTDFTYYGFDVANNRIDIWDLTNAPTLQTPSLTIPINPATSFPYIIAGIFYAGAGPIFYVNNIDTQSVELWDYSTSNTNPTISTVFTLPGGYSFTNNTLGSDNIYVDITNNIVYLMFTNNYFASFDLLGNPIDSSVFLIVINGMYIFNGDIYVVDVFGSTYIAQPDGAGGWTLNLVGQLVGVGFRVYGLAQWYDESCVGEPPIGCIVTGTTISGCSDFQIIAGSADGTCYDGAFVSISVTGGCPDYVYTLYSPDPNTVVAQVTASTTTWVFDNIFTPGTYYVSVTSCNGDTLITFNPFIITIDDILPFYVDVDVFINGFCVTLSGGTPPYFVYIDGNPLTWFDTNGSEITTNCFTANCNTQSVITIVDSSS